MRIIYRLNALFHIYRKKYIFEKKKEAKQIFEQIFILCYKKLFLVIVVVRRPRIFFLNYL